MLWATKMIFQALGYRVPLSTKLFVEATWWTKIMSSLRLEIVRDILCLALPAALGEIPQRYGVKV